MMKRQACTIVLCVKYRATLQALRKLRKAEKMSAKELEAEQRMRLKALVEHAYRKVPYYRDVLKKAGVVSGNGVDLNRFAKVPLLTKQVLRERYEDLKSQDLNRRVWYENTSGGSQGEPVRFIQDKGYAAWSRAVSMLFDCWTDYRIGDPKVILWGSERDLLFGQETLRTRFGHWLRNERWLNAFRMSPTEMKEYVKLINTVQPVQILAYTEAIYELAKFAEREGLKICPPRAVMTSAGTLFAHMREVIERVFRAPVFNRYGSREVGGIACECKTHMGLHLCPHTHYVEILRNDGEPASPGEVGEVVITSLTNYAMPLIRYRIGDMAEWAEGSCLCGLNWPLLKQIVGRLTDVFIRSDGGIVVPEYFIHMFGVVVHAPWIRRFQVIQETVDTIILRIAPHEPKTKAMRKGEEIRTDLERITKLVMGNKCRLILELVDDILPYPSGKYPYIFSRVCGND